MININIARTKSLPCSNNNTTLLLLLFQSSSQSKDGEEVKLREVPEQDVNKHEHLKKIFIIYILL